MLLHGHQIPGSFLSTAGSSICFASLWLMAMYCMPETGGLLVDGVEESTGMTTDRGIGQGAGGLQRRGLFNCRGLLWHDIGTLKWKVHVSWRGTRLSSIMILCVHS